jgi:hypothetical protein
MSHLYQVAIFFRPGTYVNSYFRWSQSNLTRHAIAHMELASHRIPLHLPGSGQTSNVNTIAQVTMVITITVTLALLWAGSDETGWVFTYLNTKVVISHLKCIDTLKKRSSVFFYDSTSDNTWPVLRRAVPCLWRYVMWTDPEMHHLQTGSGTQ